jgi:hypothetical protein
MDQVRMLWTGGWDSSFRLLQLVLVDRRAVQPIYVIDPDRASTLLEIRSMEAMRTGIAARGGGALVAPTEILVRTHFTPSPRLVGLYQSIATRARIGEQYLWLAAVAEARGWSGVEMSLERSEGGMEPFERLVFVGDGHLGRSEPAELFRFWSFPVHHLTKKDMAAEAERQGFLDLLNGRWFCFTPVRGKPCGRCHPCRMAYRADIEFANPALALAARSARHARNARKAGARQTVRKVLAARTGIDAVAGRAPSSQG